MLRTKSKKSIIMLLLIAAASLASACSPTTPLPTPSPTPTPTPAAAATVPHLDELVSAVEIGSGKSLLPLVHFSTLRCSKAGALGGPPKCLADEPEGTSVEVLPIISTEGHHFRRDEFAAWKGTGPASLYAAFRTGGSTYSDENFPAGDFGVVFLLPDHKTGVIFQVTDAGVVRIDYHDLATIATILKSNEIVLGPFPVSY